MNLLKVMHLFLQKDSRKKNFAFRMLLIMIIYPILISCSSKLDPKDYVQWIESYDNNLHLKKITEPFVFDLQYKPAAYLLLQQEGGNISHEKLTQLTASHDMQYYTLTVGLTDKAGDFLQYQASNFADQQRKLYYFSYLFQNDIYILENGKKLPCLLFHFERSYDLKPSRTFVLGFENLSNGTSPSQLIIDSPWFSSGKVEFLIEKNNIPTLNL